VTEIAELLNTQKKEIILQKFITSKDKELVKTLKSINPEIIITNIHKIISNEILEDNKCELDLFI
tara:strand:+ start:387 stop:581 length:195 start_codon:yes stop_codon:yes gene_type:complete